LSAVEQEQVWELWGTGKSLRAVARAIGCRDQQLRRYVWSTGGVRPVVRRRAAGCLSVGEREEISRGLARGDSCRQIAAGVGRSHSTVSREVARNGGRDGYRALDADRGAWERARRPKPAKLAISPMLRALVEEKLELRWSPQQIAGWLSRAYADCEAMRISHETIYLSLFVQSRGALRRELTAQLV
jgi:IS30 family transposase